MHEISSNGYLTDLVFSVLQWLNDCPLFSIFISMGEDVSRSKGNCLCKQTHSFLNSPLSKLFIQTTNNSRNLPISSVIA